MEMVITSRNIEVSDQIRRDLERKLSKLARHLPAVNECKVEISREQTRSPEHRYVVQVTVNSAGTLLRGETRAVNILSAIDEATEVMERQGERFKGKLYDKGRGSPVRRALAPPSASPQVARVKRFPVRPLPVEEAIEQMELLGHDFFLFINPDSGALNLLYRRKAGAYGLIEPETGT